MKKYILISIFCIINTALQAQWDKVVTRGVVKTERGKCKNGTDSFDFNYSVTYPFFSNIKFTAPITDSLNYNILRIAGNSLMDSNYSSNLLSLLKIESDSVYATWKRDLQVNFCYNLENTERIELLYSDKKFCTLINDWYAYDGGAHGLSGEDYLVLDTKTGKRINSWKQLFADTNTAAQIIKTEFYALKKREQCDSSDWFWGGDFYVTDNFGVVKDGLVFYYQTYEIAPYADGPTELFIPWTLLKKAKIKKVK